MRYKHMRKYDIKSPSLKFSILILEISILYVFFLSFFGVVVVWFCLKVVVWFCLKDLSYRNSKNPVLFFLKI